jgi:head-tail adaptor
MINAGKLDQPITIKAVTLVDDGMGDVTETWAALSGSPKWAEYIPLRGLERIEAGKLAIVTEMKLRIRRDTSITSACQVVHKTKTYRITGVEDNQRDMDMVLNCAEVL